jgi:uncharacterized protein with FMN-binding domain
VKKILKIVGLVFISVFILLIGAVFAIKSMGLSEELPVIQIGKVDLSKIEDGTYTGECSGGLVKAAVEVQVNQNQIVEIKILKHENGLGKKAEKVIDEVIRQQSLDVETVSGATTSSKVILKAVETALNKN